MYNDASRWRLIADANHIVDPRNLEPLIGKALIVPKGGD
jgi:nucleoid-associated protein YgaU